MSDKLTISRARVRSVDSSLNKKTKRCFGLVSLLVNGITVPVYANLDNVYFKYIPFPEEKLSVMYKEDSQGRIIIKSIKRKGRPVTYCTPV